MFGLALGCAAALCACQEQSRSPGRPVSTAKMDQPAADRLHEVSRAILFYYARYRVLPPSLEILSSLDPNLPPMADPQTRRGYVYIQQPRKMVGRPGWLMLYVAAAEPGMSWVILGDEVDAEHNIATQVLLIPTQQVAAALNQHPASAPQSP